MSLIVCQWGGHLNASNDTPSPVEEWSNTVALIGPSGPDPAGLLPLVQAPLESWFQSHDAHISASVSLDYLKVNEYNVATGHQITDPSVEYLWTTGLRGYFVEDYEPPLTIAYRVSIDDGTRNRRARGGFFAPRPIADIQHDGRWLPAAVVEMANAAQTFLSALELIDGYLVGIWSRRDHSVTASSRCRVGNVPDNIRTRKNALDEAYQTRALY